MEYFVETAWFKPDDHLFHSGKHPDPAGNIIRAYYKMRGAEFGEVTIEYGTCLVQSKNQTLHNMREENIFNKSFRLISGNDQIGVNALPEQRMRVKSVHMKHVPFFLKS